MKIKTFHKRFYVQTVFLIILSVMILTVYAVYVSPSVPDRPENIPFQKITSPASKNYSFAELPDNEEKYLNYYIIFQQEYLNVVNMVISPENRQKITPAGKDIERNTEKTADKIND